MASGLPVIASNIEPLIEYLRDGENSMLVSPLNYEKLVEQIIRFLLDAELRDELVSNGGKTAEACRPRLVAGEGRPLNHEEFYSRF